ncbi:hypothetical protein JKP88DRAFT_194055 [Tribonema minus]|uniref:PCI domain-containing protein n=1 Tax=Tribonema minus TaxID=303371 RepID=A0A835Z3R3_9STRA|nr:hypothetical protein JKP88DRAFT_194055 [Tribonema minus]
MLFQKLQVVFTHCTTNDEVPWEVSTKQVGMYLVNHQLGVLFQLNNFKQCSNAITGLVNAYWPTQNKRKGTDIPESYFSKADLVTYKYYTGRLSLFEDKYEEALTALTTALNLCHKDAYHNRRKIITVLIPLHLNFGRFPTEALLRKYDLGLYLGFTNAIRTGSIRLYNQTLYGHQNYFVRIGTYLLLERVKNIVYRCYLKRYISLFVTGDGPVEGKSPLLDLQAIQTGLRLQGEDMDLPELECILCNLIHLNLVKGYVAHVQQKLVLSKDKPFPLESVVKPISS